MQYFQFAALESQRIQGHLLHNLGTVCHRLHRVLSIGIMGKQIISKIYGNFKVVAGWELPSSRH